MEEMPYLDDIIVVGKSYDLRLVFDQLLNAGLKLKAKKCNVFAREVVYVGHVISGEGVATDPEKVKAVAQMACVVFCH